MPRVFTSCPRRLGVEIFLDEPRAQMDIHLHRRRVSDAREAVDLAGLDHQDVARRGLELLAVHGVQSAALTHELDFVVRMTMRTGAAPRLSTEQKRRDGDVAMLGADELV